MVSIQPIASASDPQFLLYPFQKYRGDPLWAPPFLMAEKQRLHPGKNPFFKEATMACFLARQGEQVVGRIAALVDPVHNRLHRESTAFFALFEAADETAAKALYRAAEDWAVQAGMTHLRGPISLTMEEGVGFQTDAFDTPPYMMMHYNGPDYPQWAEAAGYSKLKDFYAWRYRANREGDERMDRIAARARKRLKGRIHVRGMSVWHFHREIDMLFEMYNQAWADNWGFRPKNTAEWRFMSRDMRLIFKSKFSTVVELDGKPVAAALSLPDANQLTRRVKGRLLPMGWWHFLRRNKIFNRSRMAIMGVLHEWRGRGLEAILIREAMATQKQMGYVEGECSWVLEDNKQANRVIALAGCELYKTYRLYQKSLPARQSS